jgi:hypothetical protein
MAILNWNHIGETYELMSSLSREIRDLEIRRANLLPDLRSGSTIIIGSDYGGQHDTSTYQSLSFLFADQAKCREWNSRRAQLRSELLCDGRRMSYKGLNDTNKKRALFPFLLAANHIPGLSVTFLINKKIDSLFAKAGKLDIQTMGLDQFQHWSNYSFEKLLRVLHFISLFIAGLSGPGQDVFWFTDEDEIVPNSTRLSEVSGVLGGISSHYLKHDMGNLRCGTTKCDDGSRFIEDFAAIPDLIAGALADALTNNPTQIDPKSVGLTSRLVNLSHKSAQIIAWFTDMTSSLKRLVCVIDPMPASSKIATTWIKFDPISELTEAHPS